MVRPCVVVPTVALVGLIMACGEAGVWIGGGDPQSVPPTEDAAAPAADAGVGGCLDDVPSLLAHYAFDETLGLVAVDSAGAAGEGVLINMGGDDWVPGRLGNALDFDGIDDHVVVGRPATVNDLNGMTMCAWIQPRSYPGRFPTIADKSLNTFQGGWNFYIENNETFGFLTNERRYVNAEGIVLNAWQHVCASWDGSSGFGGVALYYDGVQRNPIDSGQNGADADTRDSDAGQDLIIGRVNENDNNDGFPFDGRIDDYRLYNRALSASEIEAIYGCTKGGP